nr:reverse transcriptase domain-containing protein [Tanacetum cinerariifolium]
MKQNGVSDDALRLSLFLYSLTHHAIAWYDHLSRNSIYSFDDMMRKFLSKYFPPPMVTKLRNEITKFEQKPHESLFEAWECYKLSIDWNGLCLNLQKSTKNQTISTQDQKPQRKSGSGSKFSSNNLTLKVNLSKIQSSGTIFAQRSKPNPSKVKCQSPGTNCVNFLKLQEGLKLPKGQNGYSKVEGPEMTIVQSSNEKGY